MADVGVLNLTIRDNSKEAATGLGKLAQKLESVKTAASNFDISKVSSQIKDIVDAVKDNNKTVAALGTLFNAIAAFSKIKVPKINMEPIEKFKEAFGEGIKIGNAGTQINKLREALTGDWNTANASIIGSALNDIAEGAAGLSGSDLGSIARNVERTGIALIKYAEGVTAVKAALGNADMRFRELGNSAGNGFSEGIEEKTEDVANAARKITQAAIDAVAETQQSHSPSEVYRELGHYAGEGLAIGLSETTELITQEATSLITSALDSATSTATAQLQVFNGELQTTSVLTEVLQNSFSNSGGGMQTDAEFVGGGLDRNIDFWYDFETAVNNGEAALFDFNEATVLMDDSIGTVTSVATEVIDTLTELAETTTEVMTEIDSSSQSFTELATEIDTIADSTSTTTGATTAIATALTTLASSIQTATSGLTTLNSTMAVTTQTSTQTADDLKDVDKELKEKKKDAESAAHGFGTLKAAFEGLKKGIAAMFPGLASLGNQFKRIATRMAIRSVIRQVTSAFREGVENVYRYSQAIGSSFAPAMDSAASSLQQMRNSIGAAVAPLIQSMIPVLQTVVNWLIQAINYVNQFFALLRGQSTWTRAVQTTTTAYDDLKDKAKGASKATKDLLADWDELNIIQSESGGGGAGGAVSDVADYASMFEEVADFDDGIVRVVDYIKNNFDDILNLAKKIGIVLLGWKLTKSLMTALGDMKSIAAGIGLVITGVALSWEAGSSAGQKGYFNTTDIISGIGGVLATSLGGALIGFQIGGPWGALGGFIIGFGTAISITVSAYQVENNLRMRRDAFGESHGYTREQIQAWIDSQFTFDVTGTVKILDENIKTIKAARTELDNEIEEYQKLVADKTFRIKLGLATEDENGQVDLSDIKNQYDALLAAWEKDNYAFQNAFASYLKIVPPTESEGDSDSILSGLILADEITLDAMKELGEDLGKALAEGVNDTAINGINEAAWEIIQTISETLARAQELENEYKWSRTMQNIGNIDYDNLSYDEAMEAFKYQQEQMDALKKDIYENVELNASEFGKKLANAQAELETYQKKLDEAKAAGNTEEVAKLQRTVDQLMFARDYYQEQYDKYAAEGYADSVWMQLAGQDVEAQTQAWLSFLKRGMGFDLKQVLASELFSYDGTSELTGMAGLYAQGSISDDELAKWFMDLVERMPTIDENGDWTQLTDLEKEMLHVLENIDKYDIMNQKNIEDIIDALYGQFGMQGTKAIIRGIANTGHTDTSELMMQYLTSKDWDAETVNPYAEALHDTFKEAYDVAETEVNDYLGYIHDLQVQRRTEEEGNTYPTTAWTPGTNKWIAFHDSGGHAANEEMINMLMGEINKMNIVQNADTKTLETILRMILQKIPTTLTVTPTSSFARTVQMAGSIFGNVTGDTP